MLKKYLGIIVAIGLILTLFSGAVSATAAESLTVKTGSFNDLNIPDIPENLKNNVKIVPVYDNEFVEMYTSRDGKVTFKALKKGITTIMIQLINTSNDEVIKTRIICCVY